MAPLRVDAHAAPHVPARLGVGPVSKNVVDAAIRLAERQRQTVMVIASRRQVECAAYGGGYVEDWSTELLLHYIRRRDATSSVLVCRDHGGPWQHPREAAMTEGDAMASASDSLRCDIRAGMDLLHLDTSHEGDSPATFAAAVQRLVELYGECCEFAASLGREVAFEVGLERQGRDIDDEREFGSKLDHIIESLRDAGLPLPAFVVGQTGTLVVGMSNVGVIGVDARNAPAKLRALARRCWAFGIGLKAHNADYLPMPRVTQLVRNGIDAINIAPELGVVESRAFLGLLLRLNMLPERDAFMRLAYESGAWSKWFGRGEATDEQRSLAAGHYVFATDDFRELKRRVERSCQQRWARSVDDVLGAALDTTLRRYATAVASGASEVT
jgi:hypothetical protein